MALDPFDDPFKYLAWPTPFSNVSVPRAPQPKPSDDAATLEAKGLKIVDPGYELVAKVLREKIDEVNALLAIAAKAGLAVEFKGLNDAATPMTSTEVMYRQLMGGSFGRSPRGVKLLDVTITRTERL